ncbi:MAG: DNA polymerase III subunit beta [Bryobacteraceae bacterium]|jgi:DNA polymerase-3 subunit beta
MQFSVTKSALCQALALASRVVEKRTTIPILSNVKLQAEGDFLTITATDLEAALTVRIPAKVAAPGVTTIPAKKLESYCRLLPEGDVNFKVGDSFWTSITSGRSRTRIAGMSAESFPEPPAVPEATITVPAAMFMTLVNRAKFAITTVESRFTLNGALFNHRDGRLHLVATDGHRLAFVFAELAGQENTRFLLPSSAIRNLSQLTTGAEAFAIGQDDNHLFFRSGEALLTTRKLTGNFPDYERVLPKDAKIVVSINRADLAAALSRVAQFADERSHSVKLALNAGGLEISASSVESGESVETVQCDYVGAVLEMGLNAAYLAEFLSVVDTEAISLHLNDGKSAAEFRPAASEQYRYVVMPMRI